MYIKRVAINNIRSIEELKLNFDHPAGWHVLIGDNGSGKSTILRAIALAILGPQEAPVLRLELDKYLSPGQQEGSVEMTIMRHEQDSRVGSARPLKKGFDAGVKISQTNESNGEEHVRHRVTELKAYKYAKSHIWSERPGWFSASFGPFRRFSGGNREWEKVYYSNPRAAAHLSVFGEDVALTESIEWLIALNYEKLEGNVEAAKVLQGLMRFVNTSGLLPHDTVIDSISSSGIYVNDGYKRKINLVDLSDGFRSILSMTFDLIRQMVLVYGVDDVFSNDDTSDVVIDLPGVVMIDEVDAHLHPTWQVRIGEWFLRYFPRIQFIVTTHSPLVCRSACSGSIWRLSAPTNRFDSYEVTGVEKDRLLYGNVLEAFGTELFGSNVDRSVEGQAKLERLSQLEVLQGLGRLEDEEEKELHNLQRTFPVNDQHTF